MQGSIDFVSFDDLDNLDLNKYDIKLHITLHTNKGIREGFIHCPQLAPSKALFNQTMYKWKKFKFGKNELKFLESGKTRTWFDLYEIAFNHEIENRVDMIKAINKLEYHLKSGKRILACCYCIDKFKCHRILLHSNLLSKGYNSNCI